MGLGLLAASAVASSTVKVKAGTYKGSLGQGSITISLTVAGGKLKKASLSDIPLFCASGGPPVVVKFGSAKIGRTGSFTDNGKRNVSVGPYKGQLGEKLTLSGRFTSRGTVSGTEKTTFVLNGPQCRGKTTFTASR